MIAKKKKRTIILTSILSFLILISWNISQINNINEYNQKTISKTKNNEENKGYISDLDSSRNKNDVDYRGFKKLPYPIKDTPYLQLSIGTKNGIAYITKDNKVVILGFDGSVKFINQFEKEIFYIEYQQETNFLIVLERIKDSRSGIMIHSLSSQNGKKKHSYFFDLSWHSNKNLLYYKVNTSIFVNRFVLSDISDSWFYIFSIDYHTGIIKNIINSDLFYYGNFSDETSSLYNFKGFFLVSSIIHFKPLFSRTNIILAFVFPIKYREAISYYDVKPFWMLVNLDKRISWILDYDLSDTYKHITKEEKKGSQYSVAYYEKLYNFFYNKIGLKYEYEHYDELRRNHISNISFSTVFSLIDYKTKNPIIHSAQTRIRLYHNEVNSNIEPGYENSYTNDINDGKYFDENYTNVKKNENIYFYGKINTINYPVESYESLFNNNSSLNPLILFEFVKDQDLFIKYATKKITNISYSENYKKVIDFKYSGHPISLPSYNLLSKKIGNGYFVLDNLSNSKETYFAMLTEKNDIIAPINSTSIENNIKVTLLKFISNLNDNELKNLILQNMEYKVADTHKTDIVIKNKLIRNIDNFHDAMTVDFYLNNYLKDGILEKNKEFKSIDFLIKYYSVNLNELKDLKIRAIKNNESKTDDINKHNIILLPSFRLSNINQNMLGFSWIKDDIEISKNRNYVIENPKENKSDNYKLKIFFNPNPNISWTSNINLDLKNLEDKNKMSDIRINSFVDNDESLLVKEKQTLKLEPIIYNTNLDFNNISYVWYSTKDFNKYDEPIFNDKIISIKKIFETKELTKDDFNNNKLAFKLDVAFKPEENAQPIILSKIIEIFWVDIDDNYLFLKGFNHSLEEGVYLIENNNIFAPYDSSITINPNIIYKIESTDYKKLSYIWFDSEGNKISENINLTLNKIKSEDFKEYTFKVVSNDKNIKILRSPIKFNLKINNFNEFIPFISLNKGINNFQSRFKKASSITAAEAKKLLIIKNIDPNDVNVSVSANDFWGILKIKYNIMNNDDEEHNHFQKSSVIFVKNYFSWFWLIVALITVLIFITFIIILIIFVVKNAQKRKALLYSKNKINNIPLKEKKSKISENDKLENIEKIKKEDDKRKISIYFKPLKKIKKT